MAPAGAQVSFSCCRTILFYLRRVAADSSCIVRQQSLLPIPARYRYLFIIGRFYLRAVRRKAFSLGRRGTAAKRWWMWGTVFPTSVICSCFANASFSPGRSLVCRVSSPLGHPERSILGCVAEGSALPLSLLFYHKTRRGAPPGAPATMQYICAFSAWTI